MHYFLHNSDITIELGNNKVEVHGTNTESFKVTLVDTGQHTKTAGRLQQVKKYTGNEDFMLTYGDGVSDVDIAELVAFHKKHNKIATVTAVQPDARFGGMDIMKDGAVNAFREKSKADAQWINGGFFVLSPKVLDLIQGDSTVWENDPMEQLASSGQLSAYKHHGFWQPMDTLRDKNHLEHLWDSGRAPWKVWNG